MLGLLEYQRRGRGRAERGELYGLPVLRVGVDPDGRRGETRLRRAGLAIRRQGGGRVLTPPGFDRWDLLGGLEPVDPSPLLRACAPRLALAALDRQGMDPARAAVALQGERADGEMARTAVRLCGQVRHLVIRAPRGGEKLALWLRREFGLPVLPPEEESQVDLCFSPGHRRGLELYGNNPDLSGLILRAPALREGEQSDLQLLTALWQGGKVLENTLKIT